MKSYITYIITGIFCLISVQGLLGQTVYYSHDEAGNRYLRTIIMPTQATMKSAKVNTVDTLKEEKVQDPLEDQLGDVKIKIYPNPTRGILKIEMQGNADKKKKWM